MRLFGGSVLRFVGLAVLLWKRPPHLAGFFGDLRNLRALPQLLDERRPDLLQPREEWGLGLLKLFGLLRLGVAGHLPAAGSRCQLDDLAVDPLDLGQELRSPRPGSQLLEAVDGGLFDGPVKGDVLEEGAAKHLQGLRVGAWFQQLPVDGLKPREALPDLVLLHGSQWRLVEAAAGVLKLPQHHVGVADELHQVGHVAEEPVPRPLGSKPAPPAGASTDGCLGSTRCGRRRGVIRRGLLRGLRGVLSCCRRPVSYLVGGGGTPSVRLGSERRVVRYSGSIVSERDVHRIRRCPADQYGWLKPSAAPLPAHPWLNAA
mmetsp:Transcript_18756/g.58771  ORF Transcript_18756/g.58771 Transcript_18756/m.58771 type:complete len:316 (-) Transcript_18756:4-951(-)